MGFCYEGKKLVCDVCGAAGSRKRKCPFGYCSPLSVCATCWKGPKYTKGAWKASHVKFGCDVKHAAYVAREAATAAKLAAGALLRCSAKGSSESGKVHVLFRDKNGATTGFYMSSGVYGAIPLGADATPEDFMAFGELSPAPSEFSWS